MKKTSTALAPGRLGALSLPQRLEALAKLLDQAKTLEELHAVRQPIQALEYLAKVRARGTQLHADAWVMLQEAERRIGERTLELVKAPAGRPKSVADGQISGPKPKHIVLAELGLPRQLVARCEKVAALPRRVFNDVVAKGGHLLTIGKRAPSVLSVSAASDYDGDQYGTPAPELADVDLVLEGIELDLCSNDEAQKVVKAERYFTRERSLLDAKPEELRARSAFYQPPFSEIISKLTPVFVAAVTDGRISSAISLTNCDPSTEWHQSLVESCSAKCDPYKRISFLYKGVPQKGNAWSQTFCYFGPDVDRFAETFDKYGAVWVRRRPARPEARASSKPRKLEVVVAEKKPPTKKPARKRKAGKAA